MSACRSMYHAHLDELMACDDSMSASAEEGAYGQAPSPGGGYGSKGVQRPPIAYYNNQTGGVVVTPPKSLFVNFGKDMDKVLQVGLFANFGKDMDKALQVGSCSGRDMDKVLQVGPVLARTWTRSCRWALPHREES